MHVRCLGGGGVPVVLLHSQVVAGQLWDPIAVELARERLVVVPDRIGFGYSDAATRHFSFADYADATVDALDVLGIESCDLLGFHSGSIEAIELATAHAVRVRRVATLLLAVFTESEVRELGAFHATPAPTPQADGSHLGWYWNRWCDEYPECEDASIIHGWVVDHLVCGDRYHETFLAALEYPMAEKLPDVRQPLLLLALHDALLEQMRRAIPLLPSHAVVVDMPQITSGMSTFATYGADVLPHLQNFLSD
jgi:pimeloyl-ACP methyl ester carboxylesterase